MFGVSVVWWSAQTCCSGPYPPGCPHTAAWTEETDPGRLRLHLSARRSSGMEHLHMRDENTQSSDKNGQMCAQKLQQ